MKPDVSRFAEPPRYATYMYSRSPNFKLHNKLSHAKNAIRQTMNGGIMYYSPGAWVYEWRGELGWVELHHVAQGDNVDTHPLFQKTPRVKKPIKPIPQKTIDKTIASIMASAGGTP